MVRCEPRPSRSPALRDECRAVEPDEPAIKRQQGAECRLVGDGGRERESIQTYDAAVELITRSLVRMTWPERGVARAVRDMREQHVDLPLKGVGTLGKRRDALLGERRREPMRVPDAGTRRVTRSIAAAMPVWFLVVLTGASY